MPSDPIERLLALLLGREWIANTLTVEQRAKIRALFERIADIFRRIDPPGARRTRYRRDRTERALAEIQEALRKHAPAMERELRDDLARIGRDQAVRARMSLVSTLGTENADLLSVHTGPTQARLRAILRTDPIQGRVLREHTQTWSATQYNRVRDQIRLGMVNEEATPDIVRRVLGTPAGWQSDSTGRMRKTGGEGAHRLYRGGVLTRAERDAEAIVRTAVTHVSNVGMLGTFEANADIVTGVRFVATLDDRTCFVAGTGVLAPSGYRPIEDIRPGDIVIGGSRVPRRVMGARTVTKNDMARVTLSNGEVVECTADHRWLKRDGQWTEARDLRPGDSLAYNLAMRDISWYENVHDMRREVPRETGEGEQVLRHGVLSSGAEARRLQGAPSGTQGVVRHVREATSPDRIKEAGRDARGSQLLLAGVLPGAALGAVHGALQRVFGPDVADSLPSEDAEVLLARLSCVPQAPRPHQLPDVWGPVHADPDSAQRERGLQGRSDNVLDRVLQPVGIGGRGPQAEDWRGVHGRASSELDGWAERPSSRPPGRGLATHTSEGAQARREPLHEVRGDGGRERPRVVRSSRHPVSQLPDRTCREPNGQPHDALPPLPHGRGVAGPDPAGRHSVPVTVRSVERFREDRRVFDIQVAVDRSFIVADVVVHNSTLCASLDGEVWPLGSSDIQMPPLHYNCRSVVVPEIGWEGLGVEPPEEGTRIARDMRTVDDSDLERSVSARRRTSGFGQVEKIPSSVQATEWLRAQRPSVQAKVLGGQRRAQLFRSGKVTLADLVRSDNTLVPLDELLRN